MSSARPKAFLKQAKPKKKHEQILETVDDFQAAGVEHEDAAGKWRAGDPTKSLRFFNRAIDAYSEGLKKFPASLDLAYNKARVELEIATHPVLVGQLPGSVLDALRTALVSHQFALDLDSNNADTLFNTSQVLTSIAEEIAKTDELPDTEAVQCLEQALELQDRCLSIQELRYEESHRQQQEIPYSQDADDDEDGGVKLDSASLTTQDHEEQWASIVEPVTEDTLIDTVLAQLGTLTTLCGILSSSPESAPLTTLGWVEEYSTKLLKVKIPAYMKQKRTDDQDPASTASRLAEIALARANFLSNLLEAGYRASRVDVPTYKQERDQAFAVPEIELQTSFEALLANARSLITFSSAVMEGLFTSNAESAAEEEVDKVARLCWTSLTSGLSSLVSASQLQESKDNAANLATTHFLRGDTSLLQYRLSFPPISYSTARENAAQVVKNAEVFYRNAGKLFAGNSDEDRNTALFRSAVASALSQGQSGSLSMELVERAAGAVTWSGVKWKHLQMQDMLDEGLVGPETVIT